MTTTNPILPGTELLGLPVNIEDIDEQLSQIFPEGTEGREEPGMTRASLLNLALYSERPDYLAHNAAAIARVTENAACRSLLICVDPTRADLSAHAWLQAHCSSDGGCSEQISFLLTGRSPGMLRSTVFSHLDSDLPLVFWWRGELSDSFEPRLYSRIDRFIFDSETWDTPRNQFIRLAEAKKSRFANFRSHDLAFTRLNAHRHAISNAFDLPSLRSSIDCIEGISISYPSRARMSGLYLAAWVVSRLGGGLDRDRSSIGKYIFRSAEAKCPPELIIETEEVEGDDFVVTIRVGKQNVELSRCPKQDFLRTRILDSQSGEVKEEDWLPIRRKDDAELVTEILERGGRNRSLSEVIQIAGEMLTV